MLGLISGTVTLTPAVLLPTTNELVTFPYPETVAFTLNVLDSPLAKSTIQVTVRLTGSQTPLSEALTKVKPSPSLSTITTLFASPIPSLETVTV